MTQCLPAAAFSADLPRLRGHVARHFDILGELLEALGHPEALGVLADLRAELDRRDADRGRLNDSLARLRDVLAEAPLRTDTIASRRPDFDAALRWHGARLDEFVAA